MPQNKSKTHLKAHKMSVLISQNGLSFYTYTQEGTLLEPAIKHPFKGQLNPIEILTEITNLYKQDILPQEVDHVNVIYDHMVVTGVPAQVFDPNHAVDYLKYNVKLLASDVISYDEPDPDSNYTSVYVAYENINNYFFEVYGDFNYYHYSSLLVPSLSRKLKLTSSPPDSYVFLDIKEEHFYMSCFSDGKLLAHNLFLAQAPEDILYYTLFTIEQIQLDPENLILEHVCPTENKHAVQDLLYTYIRNVKLHNDDNNYLEKLLCV